MIVQRWINITPCGKREGEGPCLRKCERTSVECATGTMCHGLVLMIGCRLAGLVRIHRHRHHLHAERRTHLHFRGVGRGGRERMAYDRRERIEQDRQAGNPGVCAPMSCPSIHPGIIGYAAIAGETLVLQHRITAASKNGLACMCCPSMAIVAKRYALPCHMPCALAKARAPTCRPSVSPAEFALSK